VIAEVTTSHAGIQIIRRQENHEPISVRVVPWLRSNPEEHDATGAFLRGCLADAYHEGRNETLDMVSRRDITQILFDMDTQGCPDGGGGSASCNYCKTNAIMAYLASVMLTAH